VHCKKTAATQPGIARGQKR